MKKTTLSLAILLFTMVLKAQNPDSNSCPKLKLDLTLFDLPYQIDAAKTVGNGNVNPGSLMQGYGNPGMNQSLSLTTTIYSSVHFGIRQIFTAKNDTVIKRRFWYYSSLLLSDFLLSYAPGGDGWLHEEYHRAVLSRFHVNSFNEMNTFPIGASLISVNHITDEDLIRFKKESPTDFIRMHVSGIEGEYLMIDRLQRQNFFHHQNLNHQLLYILTSLNSMLYVQNCANPAFADTTTQQMNRKETDLSKRDFTGLDFLGWTYDLFHPDEPYQNRGVHPLGNGINRYIKTTDLTSDQLLYLKKQGFFQWLNLISPMMFFNKPFYTGSGYAFNIAVRHLLTSFGNDISFNLFLQKNRKNLIFVFHNYNNYDHYFPAIELEWYEHPVTFSRNKFLISPRIIAGIQPKAGSFTTNQSEFLGYAGCRIDWMTQTMIKPYFQVEAKTKGWIAGNAYLKANASFCLGISARFL